MYLVLSILLLLFPPENKITIKDAWIRPSSENMATALYFTIENKGTTADTLFQVDSEISNKVELHETYTEGDMMGMRKIDFIVIEGKSSFQLKPGSNHIMVMKLKKDINEGDEEKFVLHFKQAGEINITATAKKPK
jgi:periplasmic copper chaperone A